MTTAIVIGVGNEFRRDDAVGLAVVTQLCAMDLGSVDLAPTDGEPTRLIELWSGASIAVVVDAVRVTPATPGRIHRISAQHPSASTRGIANTHGIGLGDAVSLARALDLMPQRLFLYAIEVADTDFGIGMSAEVAAAVPTVAAEVAELLEMALRPEDVA